MSIVEKIRSVNRFIHKTTAAICKDHAEPPEDPELSYPDPFRRYVRLLLIIAVAGILVAAIVVMSLRIPKLQGEKKLIDSSRNNTVKNLLLTAARNNQTINCPCQSQVNMSWCEITTFYLYAKDANSSSIGSTFNFTKEEGRTQLSFICASTNPLRNTICEHILSPVIDNMDSRTNLPTASAFNRPELLYMEIVNCIDTNEYEQTNAYAFLEFVNKSKEFNFSGNLIQLVREMAVQYGKNSSSSAEDFWTASNETRQSSKLKFSFGMEVSWEAYLRNCDPGFCDVEFPVSNLNRVLRAMGQVGGIATIISLGLKFLIWPALRTALNFPTSQQTKSSSIEPSSSA